MGKIVFFISALESGEALAKLLGTLHAASAQDVTLIPAHLDDAVRIASAMREQEVDVLVARGNTEVMLRQARLPFGIASIPTLNQEIVDAIRRAQQICNKKDLYLGFSAFQEHIDNIRAFLDILNIRIKFYESVSISQLNDLALKAKNDGIDVMISGKMICAACKQIGVPGVEMHCSYSSILTGYQRALEIQYALQRQRGSLEEFFSIFNAFSYAVFATDANGIITNFNKAANPFLNMLSENPVGHSLCHIPVFRNLKTEVLFNENRESDPFILHDRGHRYLLDIVPLSGARGEGRLLALYPANWLTNGEIALRKDSYHKQDEDEDAACFWNRLPAQSAESQAFLVETKALAIAKHDLLLSGEAGCGKEMLARYMHSTGTHFGGPFVVLNCCNTSPDGKELLNAFEEAHGGTLLLNDVGELSPVNQAILLRFLRERRILCIGDEFPCPVDVRLIATTTTALECCPAFRSDLMYLLSTFTLQIPPLWKSPGDISAIIDVAIERAGQKYGKEIRFSKQARKFLSEQDWPGNIRQLYDFCERLALLSHTKILSEEFVQRQLTNGYCTSGEAQDKVRTKCFTSSDSPTLVLKGRAVQVDEVLSLLRKYRGKKCAVASELGISRTTLWKCLRQLEQSGNPD